MNLVSTPEKAFLKKNKANLTLDLSTKLTATTADFNAKLTANKAATQANSTAVALADLVIDFNALLAKLKTAGIMV